jgi:hypothetical protein
MGFQFSAAMAAIKKTLGCTDLLNDYAALAFGNDDARRRQSIYRLDDGRRRGRTRRLQRLVSISRDCLRA